MITATLHHLRIPFKKAFGHVLATRSDAEAIVLVVERDGAVGVGECVPREYVTGESFASVWSAVTRLDLGDVDARVDRTSTAALTASVEALALPERLRGDVLGLSAACVVELALLDHGARAAGVDFSALAFALGLPQGLLSRDELAERISIPLDFNSEPRDLAHRLGSKLANLKVKVGADLARDVARVRECRSIFGASVSMSVDANMAWTLDEALRAADALRPFDIGWYEEPLSVPERSRYRELRERGGVAVMLDEAACGIEQIGRAIDDGACDLVNIRISKCGGFLASLRIAALAHRSGVRYQHGTQVGQMGFLNAAGRHFTRSVRGIVACEGGPGLANLSDHPTRQKIALDWELGHLVGLEPLGVGASPDPEKLQTYSVRRARWDGRRWSEESR